MRSWIKGFIRTVVCCFLLAVLPGMAAAAELPISAEACCLIDRETGQMLFGKNEDAKREIASTTKIMTALLAAEYAELSEEASVSRHADTTPEYTAGLNEGQILTVEDALKGALIRSYNDAAVVLAEHVAGDEAFFARLMTVKAFALGLLHTRFQNASGLPAEGHYSTAYELARLTRRALQNPVVAAIVAQTEAEFHHPGYSEPQTLTNTNPLLREYPGADGVKTGTTSAAGKCLVASASRESGAFIAVALHAPNRATDCQRLLDYGFAARPREVVTEAECMGTITVSFDGAESKTAEVFPKESLSLLEGDVPLVVERRIELEENLKGPLEAGAEVGRVEIWADGHFVRSIPLKTHTAAVREYWIDRWIKRALQGICRFLIHVW